jgi:peptidoglycan/xylan/chitin deacetylase (PgdA/CDA1 family)
MTPKLKWKNIMFRFKKIFSPPRLFIISILAITYLVYRIALATQPINLLVHNLLAPNTTASVVCNLEEDVNFAGFSPILSSSYQKRITSRDRLTANLIINPEITQINPETEQPTGYFHSFDSPNSNYQWLSDTATGKNYLRVTDSADTKSLKHISPAWLMQAVNMEKGRTYAYSFKYRSGVPVKVSIEYSVNGGGDFKYIDITKLDSSSSWKSFTAHFSSLDGDSSFRFILNGVGPGYVDVNELEVHQIADANLSKGIVSINFDDGWRSVVSGALPLFERYKFRTTQYIISDVAANNEVGYMNFSTIRALKLAGHEIGSHSARHCNQTTLSESVMVEDASRSKQMLELQNLGPIKAFSYPSGQYDKTTQGVYSKQYTYIRTSDYGYNDRYFDETNIRSMRVLSSTSDSEFKSWLDYAKANRLWLVLVYHRINESGDYSVTSAQLEKQLEMINQGGLTVLPLSEAAEAIR